MMNKFLLGFACFTSGILLGFLLFPIKNGVSIGNNSANELYGDEYVALAEMKMKEKKGR